MGGGQRRRDPWLPGEGDMGSVGCGGLGAKGDAPLPPRRAQDRVIPYSHEELGLRAIGAP
eukprot:353069-Chlamydomonas_euryale.AAC.4